MQLLSHVHHKYISPVFIHIRRTNKNSEIHNTTEILFIHNFIQKFITAIQKKNKNKNKNKKTTTKTMSMHSLLLLPPQLLLLTGEEVFFFNALIQGGLGHIVFANRYTTKV